MSKKNLLPKLQLAPIPINQYIPALDGLRGLAISLVLMVHLFYYFYYSDYLILYLLSGFFSLGWTGVDLFFVLSGFLITQILLQKKEQPKCKYFTNFISRRILRIFPLYYFTLFSFFYILPLLYDNSNITNNSVLYFIDNQFWFWTYLQNIFYFFKTNLPEAPTYCYLCHFWSLALEEQFYLIWPVLIWLFSKQKMIVISIVLITFSVILRHINIFSGGNYLFNYTFPLARMDAIVIGCLAALSIQIAPKKVVKWLPFLLMFSLFALAIAILGGRNTLPQNVWLASFGYTFIDLIWAALLIYAISTHSNNSVKWFLESKFLLFMGKYSYGIYVYHYILYCYLKQTYFVFLENHLKNEILTHTTISITCILITIPLSLLSYHYLEAPFLRLKKYFSYAPPKKTTIQTEKN